MLGFANFGRMTAHWDIIRHLAADASGPECNFCIGDDSSRAAKLGSFLGRSAQWVFPTSSGPSSHGIHSDIRVGLVESFHQSSPSLHRDASKTAGAGAIANKSGGPQSLRKHQCVQH